VIVATVVAAVVAMVRMTSAVPISPASKENTPGWSQQNDCAN